MTKVWWGKVVSRGGKAEIVLLNGSVVIIFVPVTRRLPVVLELYVLRELPVAIPVVCQREERRKLRWKVSMGVVRDRLYPTAFSKSFVALAVFFDALEDFLAG